VYKVSKYTDCDYKGSAAYNSVISATKEQLLTVLPYYKNAIRYHEIEGNAGQVKFFSDGLKFINKRLGRKGVI
jgi:uncharacterized protein (DUF427 family)